MQVLISILSTLEVDWAYCSWLIKLLNVGCLMTMFGILYLMVCDYMCVIYYITCCMNLFI